MPTTTCSHWNVRAICNAGGPSILGANRHIAQRTTMAAEAIQSPAWKPTAIAAPTTKTCQAKVSSLHPRPVTGEARRQVRFEVEFIQFASARLPDSVGSRNQLLI